MSMKLQSRVSKRELEAALADECDFQFDFLAGISHLIIRMDEVHPSLDNNNDRYIFLIWVEPDDHAVVERQISQNIERAMSGWEGHILPHTGEGLIIVSTWVNC